MEEAEESRGRQGSYIDKTRNRLVPLPHPLLHCTDAPVRKMPRTPTMPSQCQGGHPWRPPSGVALQWRHPRRVEAKDHKTMEERTCVLLACDLAAQDDDAKSYRDATSS
jgi:hypothetical protein